MQVEHNKIVVGPLHYMLRDIRCEVKYSTLLIIIDSLTNSDLFILYYIIPQQTNHWIIYEISIIICVEWNNYHLIDPNKI